MLNMAKNILAWKRTEKALVVTKIRNCHHIKKRVVAVKYHFYFFDIGTTEKVIEV